ncbi:MAG TPA: outer membrane protein assembly factor BamD [Candidatus Limnocylindria bacterium]|nr:outer membrane protein assembly factor BamD [Candidatus Limnocylindria bacterium]
MAGLRPWVLAIAVACAACAAKPKMVPAPELWETANQAYDDQAYDLAIERYKKLLDQYPFDANAEEAELRIGYAYFLAGRYEEAVAAFQDFERMHPTSPHLASVEYHRGLAHLAPYRTPDRDRTYAVQALASFRNVVDRFPGTPWASRAALRIRECREILARHEQFVANFYLSRKSLRAAEARLRNMLTEYPDMDATVETLTRFARAYDQQGEPRAAALARATVLELQPEGPTARAAREQLARPGTPAVESPALPQLLAELDTLVGSASRQNVPRAVSAYPDRAPTGAPRY